MPTYGGGHALHEVKSDSVSFRAIVSGAKTFEVRFNDRDYLVGDYIRLKEWHPEKNAYSGLDVVKRITYMIEGGQYGVEKGYVVLSLDTAKYTLTARDKFNL